MLGTAVDTRMSSQVVGFLACKVFKDRFLFGPSGNLGYRSLRVTLRDLRFEVHPCHVSRNLGCRLWDLQRSEVLVRLPAIGPQSCPALRHIL